ncbi:sensor histidine kinase [Cnuella takakiae]|nr:sensor histidine kinase [Cnuella takakiae]OLY93830.1 hypothetical protein BUE76_19545 [Cnuella takakiae]
MRQSQLIRVAVHVGGWLLLVSLLAGFISLTSHEGERLFRILPSTALLYLAGCVAIYYLNTLVLLPNLYMRDRQLAYLGVFLLLLALVFISKPLDVLILDHVGHRGGILHKPPPGMMRPPGGGPPQRPKIDIISITLFTMLWALGFGLRIQKQWRIMEQRAIQAEADKANAELSFVKAQINPHFLFNTLNNIYSMAVTGSAHTAVSIMKLSQIMRYLTEMAAQDEVPLQEAVACLTDFIDLHRLRFGPKVAIDYSIKGNLEGKQVIPLVFITFIENMFKYGVSAHEHSPIKIDLEATPGGVRFYCENKIMRKPRPGESTGIGLDNVTKRLAYAYPGKHRLDISDADGYFRVKLQLDI